MNRLSGRQALAAGFGLIVREPGAFLVWCVVCFVLGIVPSMLSIGPTLAMMGALADGGANSPDVLAAQAQVMRYQPLSYLGSLAVMVLVPPAIFRAVLFPEDRGVMYLKLGAREFWMTLIVIVLFVGYFLGILVGMIPFLILTAIIGFAAGAGGAGSAAIGGLVGVLLMMVLFGALFWVVLRLSMAPVMAFAQSTFRLTESWSLTRGHAWKLFLVSVALFALMLVAEVLIFGVFAAWAGAVAPLSSFGSDPQGTLTRLGAPFLAAGGIAFSLLAGAIYTVAGGAWADMYRQISEKPADVFA
ncbi:MAG: hypothetical protein KKE02_05115 [Alphaproteobacteria bacterium]|nr:hypothetical protein [Alphaproteobacteria bacterium]MBU1514622.1 hypothetical protein [Alphaproteobacteria bacterium]MBU2096746.1 hypothetical protein [Alphaproteobacteria bacterium]MBU2150378.1 hypothetical protein [Alphaproteobacteria bacterium]MBU2306621.1 hypothetical protein [Alphaproteobacteria bacterium]